MSGMEIKTDPPEQDAGGYLVKERLALTADDRLVPEGHPDARWLYAVPGRMIPYRDALKYGLVKSPQATKKPAARRRKA